MPQFSGGRLAGELTVLGHDPTRMPPRELAAAGVGLLFQNPLEGFVAERVAGEVAFGPENLGLPPAEVEARVAAGLDAVGLTGFGERRLRHLSTGQQQRVALAAALALRPRLLLLDEPTAHLDEPTAREILALLARVRRDSGAAVLLSEHRLGIVAPLADRTLVLAGGRLLRDGHPRDVFADPSLPSHGIPVPRATRVALSLHLPPPLPLTPQEFAARVVSRRGPPDVLDVACLPGRSQESALAPLPPQGAGQGNGVALLCEDVSFAYPGTTVPAVSSVGFALRHGEVAALVGPSGAGKSTVSRLALGLLRPTSGQIALDGLPTHRTPFSALARVGGLVLQNPLLQLLAERVDDELLLGLRHLPLAQGRSRVEQLLETFRLGDLRARHPLSLSEGQRRRVALAAVLARRPTVLVLDEPTLGQDESQRDALVRLVRRAAAGGTAVLAISHDPEFVNDACDRVLVLRAGRLAADLPMSLAYTDPARLEAAGVGLAEVPAAALTLSRLGRPTLARYAPELMAALAP